MKTQLQGQYIWLQTVNKGFHPLFCKRTAIWFRDLLMRQASINITKNIKAKNEAFLKENISSIKTLLVHVKNMNDIDKFGALELCDTEELLESIVNNQ